MTHRNDQMTRRMETMCKKCIAKGGEKWRPTESEVYSKLLRKIGWFKNLAPKSRETIYSNISGQLQLIEFLHKVATDCDLTNGAVLYDEESGENHTANSEIEAMFIKQEVIAIGGMVEAVCYAILKSNNIDLPINTRGDEDARFITILKLLGDANLLPEDEVKLCQKVRALRNKVHLQLQSETDFKVFSENEADIAGMCLYFLLQRWLKVDEHIMHIYFSFIPKASKDKLGFSF